jgi:single-stranded-DNA-specific exonuclease
VVGIVASRLVERSGRPVVLLALDGDSARGSGRSVEGFDLLAALTACASELRGYGGHRAAAGLEVAGDHIERFRAAFCAYAEATLGVEERLPVERVDALVRGAEVHMGLAEELRRLAPFGVANPTVSLMLADATFSDPRPMGEGRHVRFTVESHGARARAVAFGRGGTLPVAAGQAAAATFTLEVNEWNGVSEPRLVLRHARPAVEPDAPPEQVTPDQEPVTAPVAAAEPDAQEEGELVLFAHP